MPFGRDKAANNPCVCMRMRIASRCMPFRGSLSSSNNFQKHISSSDKKSDPGDKKSDLILLRYPDIPTHVLMRIARLPILKDYHWPSISCLPNLREVDMSYHQKRMRWNDMLRLRLARLYAAVAYCPHKVGRLIPLDNPCSLSKYKTEVTGLALTIIPEDLASLANLKKKKKSDAKLAQHKEKYKAVVGTLNKKIIKSLYVCKILLTPYSNNFSLSFPTHSWRSSGVLCSSCAHPSP